MRDSVGWLSTSTEFFAPQQACLVSSLGPVMNGGADPVSLTRLAA